MARWDLRGRTVLVTGAASGIGYETALSFALAGASVIATDVSATKLALLRQRLMGLDVPVLVETLDVTDAAAFEAFAARLEADGRVPDVVVNNAGVGYLGGFFETDADAWRRIVEVNLFGVVNGCQAFGGRMLAAGGRRVLVNVASLASMAPAPSMSAYAASKSAVEGLSLVLGMELANSPLSVICVHPGIIDTPIVSQATGVGPSFDERALGKLQAYYALKGAHPRVVADAIVDAVRQGRSRVLVGPQAKSSALMKRLLPVSLFSRLARSSGERAGFLPQTHS